MATFGRLTARWLCVALLGAWHAVLSQNINDTAAINTSGAWPFNYVNTNLGLLCPTGWTMRGSTCYQASGIPLTWSEASQACRNYGGDLAKVTSFDMNLAVVGYAQAVITDGCLHMWTGLYRKADDIANNTATWALRDEDTDMAVGRWAPSQPDPSKGLCVAVDLIADSHLWGFTWCNQLLPFVCQIPALPPGEYLCKDGSTVSEVRVCNQVEDCADASDEMADLPACASQNVIYLSTPGDIISGAYETTGSVWVINAELGKQVQLTINTLATELNVDVLEVYAGCSSLGGCQPVGTLSGTLNTPVMYASSNNWLIVRLSVDGSVGGEGWSGTWTTDYTCEMQSLAGHRQMDSVIAGPTPMTQDACHASCLDDIDCVAADYSTSGGTCTTYSQFEKRQENADYTYYGKTCPGKSGSSISPTLPNGGGEVQVTGDCNHIYSPFYPIQLLSGMQLSWTLLGGEYNTLTIEVIEVSLGPDDSLSVYDGGSPVDTKLFEFPSDDTALLFYQFLFTSGNQAHVALETASLGTYPGFQFKVCLDCRAEMRLYTGYVRTPNVFLPPCMSPEYNRLLTCEWIIITGGKIISFDSVPGVTNSIDATPNANDKIELYEGMDDTGTLLYNGTNPDDILNIVTNENVYIRFVSDAAFTAAGFAYQYHTGCPDPITSNTLTPIYPTAFESEFNITCVDGYRMNRERFGGSTRVALYCQAENTWFETDPTDSNNAIQLDNFPECVEQYCGSPYDQILNGYILNMTSPVFGGTVNFECYQGFALITPDPAYATNCSLMGTWDNLPQCSAQTCQPLTVPTDGNLSLVVGNGTTAGSVYTVSCFDGYTYIGLDTIYCTIFGNWSGDIGTCEVLKCLVPEIAHGSHNMTSNLRPVVVSAGQVVNYLCETGYDFPANTSVNITCLGNNTWEGAVPLCEDVDECALDMCNQSCINYPGSFECFCTRPYYQLDPATNTTCLDVNECKDRCTQACDNVDGGYNCICYTPYRLASQMDVLPGDSGVDPWNQVIANEHCVIPPLCTFPNLTNAEHVPHRQEGYSRYQELRIVCNDGYVMDTGTTPLLSTIVYCYYLGVPWWVLDVTSVSTAFQSKVSLNGCYPAQCPELNLTGLENPPATIDPAGPVGYQESVTLVCSTDGGASFNRSRTCLYNSITQSYELMGDPLNCPSISCPVLDNSFAPGSNLNVTFSALDDSDRLFNQTFMFSCEGDQAHLGNSSLGDNTVTCQENGHWDLGSLHCPGLARCGDPGTPAGAIQIVNNLGYFIDATVTFNCTRDGYGFSATNTNMMTLTCVSTDNVTADWDMATPVECEDTAVPVFTSCPENVTVEQYTTLNASSHYPTAIDNSGYVFILLSPDTNFYPGEILINELEARSMTWLAKDAANNTAMCRIGIQPVVPVGIIFTSCLTTMPVINLTDSTVVDIANIVFLETVYKPNVLAMPSPGLTPSVIYSPPSLVLDADSLYQTNKITITVQLPAEPGSPGPSYIGVASCYTTITAVPAQCSELSLRQPANGDLTCAWSGNEHRCILSCHTDFYLQGVASNTVTYNCSADTDWQRDGKIDSWVPECVASSGKPAQNLKFTVSYLLENGIWNPACGINAETDVAMVFAANNPGITIVDICTSTAIGLTDVTVRNFDSAVTQDSLRVTLTMNIELQGTQASNCASVTKGAISTVDLFNRRFPYLALVPLTPCASTPMTPSDVSLGDIVQNCPDRQTLQDNECLPCPPGTYVNGMICDLCPVDEYSDDTGSSSCKPCPNNTHTLERGATNSSQCLAECGENTYSSTGLPPCEWCPVDTYWENSTSCIACPSGTTSAGAGQENVGNCYALCAENTRSLAGAEPCEPCPLGTYDDGDVGCVECDPGKITPNPGAASADCSNVASCGDYCNGNGVCSISLAGNFYTCECEPGYIGVYCEVPLPSPCDSSPCFNGATCALAPTFDSYTCQCPQDVVVTYMTVADMINSGGLFLEAGNGTSPMACQQSCTDNDMCDNVAYVVSGDGFNCFLYMGGSQTANSVTPGVGNTVYTQIKNPIDLFYGTHCEVDNFDACAETPCMNNAYCEDTVAFPNGFTCYCDNFGQIVNIGVLCEISTDVCSVPDNMCDNGGTCIPISSFRRQCACPPGFTGDMCETNIDECALYEEPCFNGGNCTDTVDGFQCTCPFGFMGSFCEQQALSSPCDAIDCSPGQCVVDPYTSLPFCSCEEGYGEVFWTEWTETTLIENFLSGSNNDGLPRWIECRDVVSKVSWAEQINDTLEYFATGPCTPLYGLGYSSYYCVLDYEVRLLFEKGQPLSCSSIDDCAGNPCFNGGTCKDLTPGFTCECPAGYDGATCHYAVDKCLGSPCMNEGTCEDMDGGYACHCVNGYEGPNCENDKNDCLSHDCDSHGTCRDLLGGFQCLCEPGFTGPNCSVNVDECASMPCHNGGNCTDQVNGYQCVCETHWTGPACLDLVPTCAHDGSTCQNGGTCFDQLGGFYCACVNGTYGGNCEQTLDICGVANPCINGGTCMYTQDMVTCMCPPEFTGRGCEFATDFCFLSNCINGARCQPHESGYDCLCDEGWTGAFCEEKIDLCEGILCGANGYCAQGPCVCDGTFTGPMCDKMATRDYDIVHCGYSSTRLVGGFELGSVGISQFSIGVWVRFLEPDSMGTFLCLQEVTSLTDPNFVRDVMCVTELGSDIYTDSENLTTTFDTTINDGEWHYILATWDGTKYKIYADATVVEVTPLMDVQLPNVTTIQLGSGGFIGSTSQVIVFEGNVVDSDLSQFTMHPDEYPPQYIVHQDWSGYIIGGCARRRTPSVAYYSSENPDNYVAPDVTACPTSASLYTEDLTAMLDWTPPIFSDAITMVAQNFMGAAHGGAFAQGVYDIVYLGTTADPGGVTCAFPGYVRLGNCMPPQPSPTGTIMNCYSVDDIHEACWVSCPEGKAFLRQVPSLFTCGPVGVWDTGNPFSTFYLPHCGNVNDGYIALKVFWNVILPALNSLGTYETALKNQLDMWATGGGLQSGVCVSQPCDNIVVSALVVDDSARDILITVDMDPVPGYVGPMSDIPVADVVRQAALVDQAFEVDGIIATWTPGSFNLSMVVSCPPGSETVDGECVTCTPGTFWNSAASLCEDCHVGFYQPMDNQTSCLPCEPGNTTATTGAVSDTQCIPNCDPGYYYNESGGCLQCGHGFYQALAGQDFCHLCPMGQVTMLENSTSYNDCYLECPDGTQVMSGAVGACVNCSLGSYRKKGVEVVCMPCPANRTTSMEGSVTIMDCDLVLCRDGYYRQGMGPGGCEACPLGTYRASDMNMSECMSCGDPMLYTTAGLGSAMVIQCIRFCTAGLYYDVESDSCVECPIRQYKPIGEQYLNSTMCLDCPNHASSTISTGSISMDNCTSVQCIAGQEWDLTDPMAPACVNCSVGSYQPNPLPNTFDTCVMCEVGLTTAAEASTQLADCVAFCPSGEESVNGVCQECAIGFWKNNAIDPLASCTMCNTSRVTPSTGATAAADCSEVNCAIGHKIVNDQCHPCPLNEYQDIPQQKTCTACTPQGYITLATGSTSALDCKNPNRKVLAFVVELDLNYADYAGNLAAIKDYIVGILKSAGIQVLEVSVVAITEGSVQGSVDITIDETITDQNAVQGAITANGTVISTTLAENPNELECSGGKERIPDANGYAMCSPCPSGTFQNTSDINLCRKCEPGYNTSTTGSTNPSDCKLICEAGMEALGGSRCTACQADHYKSIAGIEDCQSCPGNSTTEGVTGSMDANQCVASCLAGTYQKDGGCPDCALGFFQPMPNQDQCIACPDNLLTKAEGSTSEQDCKGPCELNPDYCGGHGSCQAVGGTASCTCNEPYTGDTCGTRGEYSSNTSLIIGAVLGGVGGLLLLILITVCICKLLKKRDPPAKAARQRDHPPPQPQMYYPMGVAYPPEPLHMANPFAYADPWDTQSNFGYAQTGYQNGGYVPY